MVLYNTTLYRNSCRMLFSVLLLLFVAGCNSDKKDPILGVEPIDGLQSIVLSPANPSVAAGLNQQFTALGIYADGTSLNLSDKVSWNSATAAVASVNNQGLARALQPGTSVMTASFAGKTASTVFTVTTAVLTGISISPLNSSVASGLTAQYTATGVYSDGRAENISNVVSWMSNTPAVAVMNPNQTAISGLATAIAPGVTQISASIVTINGTLSASTNLTVSTAVLMSLQLTPVNATLVVGVSLPYIATGIYSDGTSANVSALVTWASSTPAIATINSSAGAQHGIASGQSAGTTQISATLGAVSAQTTLTVNAVSLSSIVVTPVSATVAAGLSRQFIATANYTDGSSADISSSAIWASSDTQVAIMNPNGAVNSGVATGQAVGTALISATSGTVAGSASLTVTSASLSSILVTPAVSSVAAGLSQQFTATGVYSNGTSANLTTLVSWTSSDNAVALPNASLNNNSGLVSGLTAGTAQIRASLGAVSAEATLVVTAATLNSITVTPVVSAVSVGLTRQFMATGMYSDGSTQNLSQSVVWATSDILIATMNANGAANSGLATGIAAGVVQISATSGVVTAASTLTVTTANLTSISVTPLNPSIVTGTAQQFNAIGLYSDGSTVDLTTVANWTSGTPAVASINASQQPISGLATAVAAGISVIGAAVDGVNGNSTLTVTAATLVSIEVTPGNAAVLVNATAQFTATGSYSDNSTLNITDAVTWSSSDTTVAVMNANNQLTSGLATAIAAGTTNVAATLGLVQDSGVLTVTAPNQNLPDNPQAPPMGELQRFVIIASQAVTTTAGSAISNGDMAILDLARTAYAGFTPGPVAGQFTQLTNGVSFAADDVTPPYVVPVPYASMVAFINQVRTDLGIAATFLAADPNPAAATQALPAELGGLVLSRGVYRNAGNVVIQQGNLTLDAQGDPDSVFIFVVAGTFTTGAPGGNIVLTGGAKASNVFWRTGGATVFGTNTNFAGNVLAWPQINLGTGTTVTGRLFSVTEQVTLDANTVTKPQ